MSKIIRESSEHQFKYQILGINKETVREKLEEYILDIENYLLINKIENITVTTKIKDLGHKELDLYVNINVRNKK